MYAYLRPMHVLAVISSLLDLSTCVTCRGADENIPHHGLLLLPMWSHLSASLLLTRVLLFHVLGVNLDVFTASIPHFVVFEKLAYFLKRKHGSTSTHID